jgi:cell wall-associated NlpC family hydrolase
MDKKLFVVRFSSATTILTISASLAVAKPTTPQTSAAPVAQPSSAIAPPLRLSARAWSKTASAPARATAPLAPSAPAPLADKAPQVKAPQTVDVPVAGVPVADAPVADAPIVKAPVAQDGPSAADLKLLAQLDAQLNATAHKLDKANAQLTSGQKQLVRVASLLQSEMLQGGPDSRGLHPFVRVAERYAGTPYVWGGESARGFDCSGFIIRVMRDLGYQALPHSAAEQFRYGIPVAKQNLRPGDLVFFANTYKPGISHVGIYLGRGRFIHAAGTGLGTIVSSLNSGHYQEKYAGARRLMRLKN